MRYLKPHFYDQFTCTAGDCPDTCCAGWQIVIDEDSLERYGKEQGEFGKRLRNSIDWEEECFYQKNRRCAFLNDENLCDLYKALGPDALCDTCRLYPRHTEEYEGLRELFHVSFPVHDPVIPKHSSLQKYEKYHQYHSNNYVYHNKCNHVGTLYTSSCYKQFPNNYLYFSNVTE